MNTTTSATKPIPFDYSVFIADLSKLLIEGQDMLLVPNRSHNTVNFKRWRVGLEDLLDRIKERGYSIKCKSHGRLFGYANTESAKLKNFDRDLEDTLLEIEQVLNVYERYGVPNLPAQRILQATGVEIPKAAPEPAQLTWARVFTHDWLSVNVPASAWASLVAAIFVIFVSGFTLGASKLGKTVSGLLLPDDSHVPVAASVTSPMSESNGSTAGKSLSSSGMAPPIPAYNDSLKQ